MGLQGNVRPCREEHGILLPPDPKRIVGGIVLKCSGAVGQFGVAVGGASLGGAGLRNRACGPPRPNGRRCSALKCRGGEAVSNGRVYRGARNRQTDARHPRVGAVAGALFLARAAFSPRAGREATALSALSPRAASHRSRRGAGAGPTAANARHSAGARSRSGCRPRARRWRRPRTSARRGSAGSRSH